MFVTVDHEVFDTDKFWAAAKNNLPNLPSNLKLHFSTPSTDNRTVYCLWEADSVDSLKNWLEGAVGEFSRNEYHEVDESKAIGLPGAASATAG